MAGPWAALAAPVGTLWLVAGPGGIRGVRWRPPAGAPAPARLPEAAGPDRPGAAVAPEVLVLLSRARAELAEYFAGKRRTFTVPLDTAGMTAFTRRVLEETAAVPFGETVSYGELARRVGCPRAARAVGRALAANPLPILIPCHRVVRADGSLGGYAPDADRPAGRPEEAGAGAGDEGAGAWRKRWLLRFERSLAG